MYFHGGLVETFVLVHKHKSRSAVVLTAQFVVAVVTVSFILIKLVITRTSASLLLVQKQFGGSVSFFRSRNEQGFTQGLHTLGPVTQNHNSIRASRTNDQNEGLLHHRCLFDHQEGW